MTTANDYRKIYNHTNDPCYMQEVFCYAFPEKVDGNEFGNLIERLATVAPEFEFRDQIIPFHYFEDGMSTDYDTRLVFAESEDTHSGLPECERDLAASKIAAFIQTVIGDRELKAWKTYVPHRILLQKKHESLIDEHG
jgi:hypothetical protein